MHEKQLFFILLMRALFMQQFTYTCEFRVWLKIMSFPPPYLRNKMLSEMAAARLAYQPDSNQLLRFS